MEMKASTPSSPRPTSRAFQYPKVGSMEMKVLALVDDDDLEQRQFQYPKVGSMEMKGMRCGSG